MPAYPPRQIARLAVFLTAAALASGCAQLGDSLGRVSDIRLFGGANRSSPARLSTGKDKHDMVITVRPANMEFARAQELARYEATKHCIKWTGSSETDWATDPETGEWATGISGNALVFNGRCRR